MGPNRLIEDMYYRHLKKQTIFLANVYSSNLAAMKHEMTFSLEIGDNFRA